MNQTIKTIFIGTPDFAVPFLTALIADPDFLISAIITQPDRPVGRKQILTPPPVKSLAEANEIPVFQPEILKNNHLLISEIKKLGNPRDVKAMLAREVVKMYHGEKASEGAEVEFNKVFRNKEMPSDMPVFETDKINYPILDLLFDAKLASSKKEAKKGIKSHYLTQKGQ